MNAPLWFSNLLSWSVQVALLAVLATLLPRLFRIRQPGVLLAYWRGLVLVSLLLPLLQPWQHLRIINAFLVARTLPPAILPAPSIPLASHWQLPDAQLLAWLAAVVILSGIALQMGLLALGLWRLRQLRRTSRPIHSSAEPGPVPKQLQLGSTPRVEFRLSASVHSPVTFGFAAPIILLPERFSSLDPRFQTAIACHELLHVRRRDWAHHLAEEVLRGVFWFHPAIAWLISRVRLAREQVVDLEVVKLTGARKTYLEALLEFTAGRTRFAAIPAPPFLAERQLVARVALMLKEVRMSRGRLITSLALIAGCLVFSLVLTVRLFPLKAAPVFAQAAPGTGVAGGVSGGPSGGVAGGISGSVSGGVSGSVSGGISGGIAGANSSAQSGEPNVDYDSIWTDTVKRGPMSLQVRGLGVLVRADNSSGLVAKVSLPATMTRDVRPNETAIIDAGQGKGSAKGHVVGVNGSSGDTSLVFVAADTPLPAGINAGTNVDVVVDIERLDNVLYIHRPAHGPANTTVSLFKISADGLEATRVNVKLGRMSVNTIEVLEGLKEGDKIILSDLSPYDHVDRVRLTNDKNLPLR